MKPQRMNRIDPRPAMLAKATRENLVTAARFIDKTEHDPVTGCLVWTGAKAMGTHGLFCIATKTVSAQRAAFRLFCSPVLPKIVMKTCQTMLCVHPGHLAADPRRGPRVDNLWTC